MQTTMVQISLHIRAVFVVCCLDSIIPLVSISEISSLYLASVAESTLVANPEDRFSHDLAHIAIILSFLRTKLEQEHEKTNKNDLCAQQRLRSAWDSVQSDQSLLSTWRRFGSLATKKAHSKDSDQTGWTPRLIRVFAGHTGNFVGFAMLWLN